MLNRVKYKKENIEKPNEGKRNANLDKVLIYRTAIKQVANDVKKSRIKCRKQQSIKALSCLYDTIVFLICQEFFRNFYNFTNFPALVLRTTAGEKPNRKSPVGSAYHTCRQQIYTKKCKSLLSPAVVW